MAVKLGSSIPILRMFDVKKAKEFYRGFLGFTVDWEHRFEPNTPVYMQVSRGKIIFHLSEHYGDGVPGAAVMVVVSGIEDYLLELRGRQYKYYRPGIQVQPWNAKEMAVIDPFGNRIRFTEFLKSAARKNRRKKKTAR